MTIAAKAVTSATLQVDTARHGSTTAEMAAVLAQWHAVSSYGQESALRASVWQDKAHDGITFRISVIVKHSGGMNVAFEGVVGYETVFDVVLVYRGYSCTVVAEEKVE